MHKRKANVIIFLQSLSQILPFAVVGTLKGDSSNIIDLISETYNVILHKHNFVYII